MLFKQSGVSPDQGDSGFGTLRVKFRESRIRLS